MGIARSFTATLSVALLAIGGHAFTAASLQAATEVLRPGAQRPSLTANSSWLPEASIVSIAQPFVQTEGGNLASLSIELNVLEGGYQFRSVALHEFTAGVGPSASPVTGGTNASFLLALNWLGTDQEFNVWNRHGDAWSQFVTPMFTIFTTQLGEPAGDSAVPDGVETPAAPTAMPKAPTKPLSVETGVAASPSRQGLTAQVSLSRV